MSADFAIPGADWRPMPVADARKELGVDTAELESLDLAGGLAKDALVHRGDLTVDGALSLRGRSHRLHVIAGDLRVTGTLDLLNLDLYTCLHITGSVHAGNLVCTADAGLVVAGSLDAGEILLTCLTDAATLIVGGDLTAGTWIEAGWRGNILTPVPPGARLLTENGSVRGPCGDPHLFGPDSGVGSAVDAVLPEFTEPGNLLAVNAIRRALLEGRPVLRAREEAASTPPAGPPEV
ncbi:hypothetical protein [Streptomyces sp. CAU 1734]|uniref:hypothetical protein n=1 Tax=Streptomyces sp. CAU 1734 TaxID=3140360 RepID=UPI00326044E1